MINISPDQALERWDTLPIVLREALYFEPNSDFLWKTCEAENIPDEKIYDVAKVAGYVLMGFLHPEDLAGELKEQLGLDPKLCASIADAINQRVFAPLRQDIDKVYEPPSRFGVGPKILSEITAPKIISQIVSGAPTIGMSPLAAAGQAKTAPPPIASGSKLQDVGWSKTTPEGPVVKLSQTSAPQPSRVGPSVPPPTPAKQIQIPIKGSVGEFERIAIQGGQKTVPAQPVPAAATPRPAVTAEPGPVIIHEDAVSRPQQTTPNFRIQMTPEKFDASKIVQPVRPAVLELGKATPPPQSPQMSTTQVVHYSEYKAPQSAPQGQRQITEITVPPAIAGLPKPPTPPAPPAATQNKIVYKDYTATPLPPKAPPASPTPPPMLPQK